MPLFPFAPSGLQEKLDELYQLSDAQLLLRAEAIELDFREWIKNSFI